MVVSIESAWIIAVALIALRVAGALALTPLFATAGVPANFRVLFVVAISVTLMAGLAIKPTVAILTLGQLVNAAVTEIVVGMSLAFGVFTAFATFQLAGRIMDLQLGFGVATLIDPTTRAASPLLGTFLNLLALTIFFTIDGHHLLISGIAFSLEQIPPGTSLSQLDPSAMAAQFGAMFVYAAALAAPVMVVMLLIDIVMAVIARTMPQVNVFIVGLPLKIMVGLTVLAISLRYMTPVMKNIFEQMFNYWHAVASGPSG
jgi:flagellar biosynthetic protein FliR